MTLPAFTYEESSEEISQEEAMDELSKILNNALSLLDRVLANSKKEEEKETYGDAEYGYD